MVILETHLDDMSESSDPVCGELGPWFSSRWTVLGARVKVGGEIATVRFRGEVPPTKGLWLGVEWDNPSRGKHDGLHNGVRYFTPVTPNCPTSCSFLRTEKVNWGIPLMKAISEKYGAVEGATAGVVAEDMHQLGKEMGARFFQVIGMDKVNAEQARLENLKTISVRNMSVNGGGSDNLGELLPRLRDLDMSETLLSNWDEVARICGQLKLEVLYLSQNVLPVPHSFTRLIPSFERLNHLVLGQTEMSVVYTWPQIVTIAGDLPCLEVLQVHNNKITRIENINKNKFLKLKKLDLDGNCISSWSQDVDTLGDLPCLETLHLNGNKIDRIVVREDSFKCLRNLQLSFNLVDDWGSVGELDKLAIRELRFRNNPVNEDTRDSTGRQLIIARIASLVVLNGSSIAAEVERKYAEFDYIKKYGEAYLAIKGMPEGEAKTAAYQDFVQHHNRYIEIVSKYGEPEEGEFRKEAETLKASLVRVAVSCPDVIGTADMVRKLPPTMTISKLRALLGRLVRKHAGGAELKLSVVSSKQSDHEVVMDNDMRDLSFYSVEEGDKILVRW